MSCPENLISWYLVFYLRVGNNLSISLCRTQKQKAYSSSFVFANLSTNSFDTELLKLLHTSAANSMP